MAVITSDCGEMCSLSIKWPDSPRVLHALQVEERISETQVMVDPQSTHNCRDDGGLSIAGPLLPVAEPADQLVGDELQDRRGLGVAIGETVVLLTLPLPVLGVSIDMARECQQNDSLADG